MYIIQSPMRELTRFLKPFFISLILLYLTSPASAGTIISKAVTGGWSATTTWVGGAVPSATDSVVVVAGASISTGTNQSCGAINILGTVTETGGNYLTVAGDGVTSFGSVAGNGVLGFSSVGNRNIQLTGDWTFNGTSGNSGENITFNGTGNQILKGVISTGTAGTGIVVINKASGQVLLGGNITLNNLGLTVTSGTFNPNGFVATITTLTVGASGTLIADASTFAGNYTVTTVNAPSAGSTILYTNANPAINAAITYQNLSFSGSGTASASAALTIQGSLSNIIGTLNFGSNNVTISGTVAANSIAGFSTTGTVSFTKTAGTTTLAGNISSGPLIMNGNGGTLNLGSGLAHNVTNVTMTKGTLNCGSSTFNFNGTWTGTGAIFTAGTGTIGYSSSVAQTVLNTLTYYNLAVSGAGTKTITATPLNVSGTLSLSSGSTLTTNAVSNYNINVGGNWTNNGGTFTNTNTTVILNASAAQTIGGTQSTTFNNLTISTNGANTLLGIATTVTNQLKFTSGNIDATNFSLTINAGAPAITGASASSYIITGNGATTTGKLNINSISASTANLFPIGTASYYLPVTVNPGVATGENFSAFVFQGITTNGAANGSGFGSAALTKLLNAVWDVSRTAGTGSATIAFNWSASGLALEGSSFQNFGLTIGVSHYTGGGWQNEVGSGSVTAGTATASFTSFSPFSIGQSNSPLAVTLIDFNAVLNNNIVHLSWSTSIETSQGYFDIEKINNGSDWKSIGKIQAKGSSSQQEGYSFNDANTTSGAVQYRLKIADADGNFTYSPIRTINAPTLKNILVFPNPASSYINIFVGRSDTDVDIRLFNQFGQVLQTKKIKAGITTTVQLPVNNYASGTYLVEIRGADGSKQSSIVLVNKQ
jgi:hypothetical protein